MRQFKRVNVCTKCVCVVFCCVYAYTCLLVVCVELLSFVIGELGVCTCGVYFDVSVFMHCVMCAYDDCLFLSFEPSTCVFVWYL